MYESLQLCHSHLGLTVFQNTEEVYPINEDVNRLVRAGYIEGIENTKNVPIPLDSGIKWDDYLSYSTWDASAELNPTGFEELQKIQSLYNLDYILVARDYETFYKGNACNGAWFKTQMNEVRSFVPIYVALVFDAKSGSYIGSTFINNNNHSLAYSNFSNLSKLQPTEVEKLVIYSKQAATKAAIMFFK